MVGVLGLDLSTRLSRFPGVGVGGGCRQSCDASWNSQGGFDFKYSVSPPGEQEILSDVVS